MAISSCCLLVRPPLHLQPLGLQPLVLREVAGIRLDRALIQLQRAVGHAVEEIAVVADDEDRLLRLDRENLRATAVASMSRWFDGSSSSIRSGSASSSFASSRRFCCPPESLADLLLERRLGEAEPLQHPLDAVVEVVGVVMLQLVLDVLEPVLQPLSLGFVGLGGDRVGDFFRVAGQIGDVRQRRVRLRPRRCGPAQTPDAAPSSRASPTNAAPRGRCRPRRPPATIRISVVLPAPLGPTSDTRSPGRISNVTPASTGSGPKCLTMFVDARAGSCRDSSTAWLGFLRRRGNSVRKRLFAAIVVVAT